MGLYEVGVQESHVFFLLLFIFLLLLLFITTRVTFAYTIYVLRLTVQKRFTIYYVLLFMYQVRVEYRTKECSKILKNVFF